MSFGPGATARLSILAVIAGAVLTAACSDGDEAKTEDPAGQVESFSIVATDNRFDREMLTAPAGTEVTFTLENEGAAPHNLSSYPEEGGAALVIGEIVPGGQTTEVTFATPGRGTYFFVCDVHPVEMIGDLVVE